jgi:hypothetical protein
MLKIRVSSVSELFDADSHLQKVPNSGNLVISLSVENDNTGNSILLK